jgi:YjbE family integral membrane protein
LDTAGAIASAWNGGLLLTSLGIILIDLLLSGDNSVIIAMAVHSLPPEKRLRGVLLGTGLAVVVRVGFTWLASNLFQTPFLKMVGGVLILLIALKLLLDEATRGTPGKPAESLWHAAWIILVADATMSLDNVLAVAGVARGSATLLWMGLGLSIPLVIFCSTLLLRLMDRHPFILVLGAALLGKVGGGMIITDPILGNWAWSQAPGLRYGWEACCVAGVLAMAYWLRRHPAEAAAPAEPPGA